MEGSRDCNIGTTNAEENVEERNLKLIKKNKKKTLSEKC